ncbi:MAG: molybdenum cofactor guanylyltransferase [Paenibacillaceae bacterium]
MRTEKAVSDHRGIVLLAGGASRRMGQDKWMLETNEATVLERIISVLYPLGTELWVIAAGADELDDPNKFPDLSIHFPNLHTTHDKSRDMGPLAGIAAGLAHCAQPYILVSATDMPFPSKTLAEALFDLCLRQNADAAVPEWKGRLHPLFAIYRRDCLDTLTAYLAGGGRKVMDWLLSLDIAILPEKEIEQLDPEGTALFNMNRQEDYTLALKIIRERAGILRTNALP